MSIRPMDLQVLFGKMQEVAKNQQNQEQLPNTNQQIVASESLREAERQTTQVQQTPRTEGERVENNRENRSGQQYAGSEGQKREEKEDIEEKDKSSDPIRGKFIDIRL